MDNESGLPSSCVSAEHSSSMAIGSNVYVGQAVAEGIAWVH